MFSAVGVIPARYGSSRLPGKPLADLQGKPLLYHVYHRAAQAKSLREVWIATDDRRIYDAARGFDAKVVMTRASHRSGTDRIAEVAEKIEADVIVNIQGDEPLIDFAAIDHAVRLLQQDPHAHMATLKASIGDPSDLWNPSVVKVVADQRGYAVYFSRAPIPYPRVKDHAGADLQTLIGGRPDLLRHFFRHIGLYAYRRDFLLKFTGWAPTPLELLEDLEQLRAVEHGSLIRVDITHASMFGVDTPEDLERIRKMVGNNPDVLNA